MEKPVGKVEHCPRIILAALEDFEGWENRLVYRINTHVERNAFAHIFLLLEYRLCGNLIDASAIHIHLRQDLCTLRLDRRERWARQPPPPPLMTGMQGESVEPRFSEAVGGLT